MKPSGIVTLLTDFGLDDAYVGAVKGAILAVHTRTTVIDISHGVRPFAVLQGAFLLDTAWRSFPLGTVHVAVVDPGVGTSRKAIAFRAADHIFTGPDNGLFTFLTEPISEMVELAAPPEAAPTFHGRDLFGPVAARLAAGTQLAEVGRLRHQEPLRLQDAWAAKVGEAWRAQVLHCDHFGNVISNLPLRALARIKVVNGSPVRTVETYDEAEPHELVALMTASIVATKDHGSLVARHTATIASLGIRIHEAPAGIDGSVDTIVDGLFGTGIRLPLREPGPRILSAMNEAGRPIVSIDVPSGIDADTGVGAENAVRAAATVTLAAPKAGLRRAQNSGRVFVADIGMPATLFSAERTEIEAIYRAGSLVELSDSELT